jgi:hypothetical protein
VCSAIAAITRTINWNFFMAFSPMWFAMLLLALITGG